jgi:chorismate mutase / prephenate dehydrogenase
MDDISRIRDRIDELDQEIVQLLKSRYENAKYLGRIKSRKGLEYRDPERENTIQKKIERKAATLGLDPKLVRPVFDQIFSLAIQAQKDHSKHTKRLDKTKILIVGGTGGMGRLFARFLALQGANVKLAGRQIDKTRKAAKELEVDAGTILDAASSDIVVLSVPMQESTRVATETASLMTEESLLLDLASVKTGISDKISEKIPKNIEYVSLHPLFGPSSDHFNDQSVIVIPYRAGPKWAKLSRVLQTGGAKLVTMSASQHDKAMAYAQGLHHFALICLGTALNGVGGEPRPRSLADTEKRIAALLESWDTIVGIQELNPFVPEVRQKFLDTSTKLAARGPKQSNGLRKRLGSNVQKWSRKL